MEKLIKKATEKNDKILLKIKQLRQEKRYSREEVAERLGIDTSTYTRIENGDVHLKMKTFMMIVEILDTDEVLLFANNPLSTHIV